MISFLHVGQMPAVPNCDYMESGCCTFQVNVFVPLQAARRNYLKECRKCTLLRFSFSGLWDAMWENSLKMSRYVASPGEEKKQNTECKWWKMIRVRSDSSRRRKRKRKKKSLTWFFWTVKTSFIWNLWAEELWVRKRPRWKERRHREASLFQLSGFWAFTFLVAMVTAESTDTTKAVEVFCVPWELPGPAN